MVVLGINNIRPMLGGLHESAASLVSDGKVINMIEEERLSRVRHSGGYPNMAIEWCLSEAGIEMKDIGYIALSQNPNLFIKNSYKHLNPKAVWKDWANVFLFNRFGRKSEKPVIFIDHHLAHAASSYRMSGFKEANILTIDSSGEVETAALFKGVGGKIDRVWTMHHRKPFDAKKRRSIGRVYSAITRLLGFGMHGEGKTMGLASYGKPKFDFSDILNVKNHKHAVIDSQMVKKKFGYLTRGKEDALTQDHKDLAASLQSALEGVFVNLAREAYETTGIRNFCLAGGVTLNCNANSRILAEDFCDNLFVQPASNDAGCALGAALEAYSRLDTPVMSKMETAYLGPEFSDKEIKKALDDAKVRYSNYGNIEETTAKKISEGKIVGWFQGRMEAGPRALGNRSILADPTNPKIADIVNENVKHREKWRPFAPSVTLDDAHKYFEDVSESPFMLLTFYVLPEWRKKLPAITHVDGSSRIQTVRETQNPRYYKLLREFEKIKGVPMILNTSFNDKGEPIVATPKDALRCFFSTGFDVLAIGNYLIEKQ